MSRIYASFRCLRCNCENEGLTWPARGEACPGPSATQLAKCLSCVGHTGTAVVAHAVRKLLRGGDHCSWTVRARSRSREDARSCREGSGSPRRLAMRAYDALVVDEDPWGRETSCLLAKRSSASLVKAAADPGRRSTSLIMPFTSFPAPPGSVRRAALRSIHSKTVFQGFWVITNTGILPPHAVRCGQRSKAASYALSSPRASIGDQCTSGLTLWGMWRSRSRGSPRQQCSPPERTEQPGCRADSRSLKSVGRIGSGSGRTWPRNGSHRNGEVGRSPLAAGAGSCRTPELSVVAGNPAR